MILGHALLVHLSQEAFQRLVGSHDLALVDSHVAVGVLLAYPRPDRGEVVTVVAELAKCRQVRAGCSRLSWRGILSLTYLAYRQRTTRYAT